MKKIMLKRAKVDFPMFFTVPDDVPEPPPKESCVIETRPPANNLNPDRLYNTLYLKCSFEGCNKKAVFGFRGVSIDRCRIHKRNGMIPTSKMCKYEGCTKQPSFGFKKIERCGDHKEFGMTNLNVKRCTFEGCNKIPSFGVDKIERCAEHAEKGMFSIKNKKCEFEGCKKQAGFGFPGGKKMRCGEHKKIGMININVEKYGKG